MTPALLVALLKERHLSQVTLARTLSLHPSIINHWATGRRPIPQNRLEALAEGIGMTVADMEAWRPAEVVVPEPRVRAYGPNAGICAACGGPTYGTGYCGSCGNRERWRSGAYSHMGRLWRPEEDDLLRFYAGKLRAREIATKLPGRTTKAITIRAEVLGLFLGIDRWGAHRLAQLFGASDRSIRQFLIGPGLLPTSKEAGRFGCWCVDEEDIVAFLRAYPWMYDARRMRPQHHRLARLAQQIQTRDRWMDMDEVSLYMHLSRTQAFYWYQRGVIPMRMRQLGGMRCLVARAADLPEVRDEVRRRLVATRAANTANLLQHRPRRVAGKAA